MKTTTKKPRTYRSTTLKRAVTIPENEPEKHQPPYHPAFGKLGRDVDLGIAILIAEDEAGSYEVLGPVATINESIEIARADYASRLDALDHTGDPMVPDVYKVWSRNYDGVFSIAFEIREEDGIL